MYPNGMDTNYSSYVRNTVASSSSTTMIVSHSSSPPSDNDDIEGENVDKKATDDADHDHSLDIKKQKRPYYHYNSLKHPHTPLCQLHQDTYAGTFMPPNATSSAATIPPNFSTTDYASSYFPTIPNNSSTPIPFPVVKSGTSISVAPTDISSPKKKVKRWIVAALMIVVGLLIALTFILIGLGKAFNQPLHAANGKKYI